ncbi:MAG: response regulator transcription factor [Anaerolineales bacterium]|nr:response regulator transcription factor [Anaerolineales bacterium]
MRQIRVYIIDVNAAVRRALATRLEADPHLQVVGMSNSLSNAGPHLEMIKPDVVIYGLNHKIQNNVSTAVRELSRTTPTIVLVPYADELERQEMLDAGVKLYLLKQIDSTRLIREIDNIAYQTI